MDADDSSVDINDTLNMISNLDMNPSNTELQINDTNALQKKRTFKLNPLNKLNTSSVKPKIGIKRSISISRSLSQSGTHTPPGVSPTEPSKMQRNLPSIDTSTLSSLNNSEIANGSGTGSCRSNLISSINSQSDYVTPRSNGSISSLSSMEWDSKNMKRWNKEKTKKVLFRCTRHGRYKEVRNMLEKGINPNTIDEYGNTILLVAAQNGSKRLVKTALRYNANIDHQNHRGNTAAHYAFAYGYKLLGEYILSKGADDRVKNEFGLTCYEGIKMKSKMKMSKDKSNTTAKQILKGDDQNQS
eukprot:322424_1